MGEKMKLVYVAGPYTGKTKIQRNINIEKAREVGLKLWEAKFAVITPHLNSMQMDDYLELTQEDYYEADMVMLSKCDAIFMVEGWKYSVGSIGEHSYAIENNIPVFTDIEKIKIWQMKEKNTEYQNLLARRKLKNGGTIR